MFDLRQIERVQNKMLWQQYQAKKQQMELSNPPNTKNESLLWHGSSSTGIDNILVHGFDRSYSNMGMVAIIISSKFVYSKKIWFILSFLAHLSQINKVSFCDHNLYALRKLLF
jgi:hypothetical protein